MFLTLASTRVAAGGVSCFVKAIFAGWLVALLVWMLPATRTSRVFVIIFVTYLIGLAGFPHIVAGGVDTFYSLLRGHARFGHAVAFLALTLAGNITGGVLLVGLVNHGQVTAGQQRTGRRQRMKGTRPSQQNPEITARPAHIVQLLRCHRFSPSVWRAGPALGRCGLHWQAFRAVLATVVSPCRAPRRSCPPSVANNFESVLASAKAEVYRRDLPGLE